eukprot:9395054-Heterocapsa_arctica.AAC.1
MAYRGHLDEALINWDQWCALRHREKPCEVWEDELDINEMLIIVCAGPFFEKSQRSETDLRHARHAILSVQTKSRQRQ